MAQQPSGSCARSSRAIDPNAIVKSGQDCLDFAPSAIAATIRVIVLTPNVCIRIFLSPGAGASGRSHRNVQCHGGANNAQGPRVPKIGAMKGSGYLRSFGGRMISVTTQSFKELGGISSSGLAAAYFQERL
jgi:hypothetical protein